MQIALGIMYTARGKTDSNRHALLKRLPLATVMLSAMLAGCGRTSDKIVVLHGAGSTLPAPLYRRWIDEYCKAHPDVQIQYEAVGSGEGVRRFTHEAVDFGASDVGMTDEEIARVPQGVQLIPMTASALVLAYNPDGLPPNLCLSRAACSGICLGRVSDWNDAQIAAYNEDTALPDMPIVFVHRSDESGSSIVLHRHLCAVSEEWRNRFGAQTAPAWPVGIAGKGEDGIVELVRKTPGAIGYMSYSRAAKEKLPMARLENNAGALVAPTLRSGQEGLAGFHLPPNLRAWIEDPPGRTAYPIITLTWLLCYDKYSDPRVASTIRDFIHFGLSEDGQYMACDYGFLKLPEPVVTASETALDNIQ
jgi:phosphate transport system substrate-binding protein